MIGTKKTVDFAYWGRMKHGNDRENYSSNLER